MSPKLFFALCAILGGVIFLVTDRPAQGFAGIYTGIFLIVMPPVYDWIIDWAPWAIAMFVVLATVLAGITGTYLLY